MALGTRVYSAFHILQCASVLHVLGSSLHVEIVIVIVGKFSFIVLVSQFQTWSNIAYISGVKMISSFDITFNLHYL